MSTEIKTKGHFRSHLGFYSMLIIALTALGYVWFSGASENEKLRESHEVELAAVKVKADSLLQIKLGLCQALTTKVLASAMSDMTNEERNKYFDQLIKYKGINEISFEDTNKTISSSTNQNYISKSLIAVLGVQMNYQNTDTQTFFQKDKTIICHPVITEGKIEGTLITVYPKTSI